MRSLLIAMALTLTALPAWAETSDVKKCVSDDPSTAVAGCTAVIQAGQMDTTHLAKVYVIRGNAYSDQEMFDQAVADYTKAIALKPDPVAFSGRGLVYAKQGQKDLAIADFRAALQLDPTDQASLDGLKRLGAT